jgi:hypothetical protein
MTAHPAQTGVTEWNGHLVSVAYARAIAFVVDRLRYSGLDDVAIRAQVLDGALGNPDPAADPLSVETDHAVLGRLVDACLCPLEP